MDLVVNGKQHAFVGVSTIKDLLKALDKDVRWIAVAVDRTVIPQAEFVSYRLESGQEIEILTPMQGG